MALSDTLDVGTWVCAQIGARQRYFVPRALAEVGALELFLTDAWFEPGHPVARTRRMKGRFNAGLAHANVWAPNIGSLTFETLSRLRRDGPLERMMARNEWFQRAALRRLRRLAGNHQRTLVGFSYASRHLFAYAKARGWRTVLDQMDPGPFEEKLIQDLHRSTSLPTWPERYWAQWREETKLADIIVVNSNWSREGLLSEGVAAEKIRVIPLVYDGPLQPQTSRQYPVRFDAERPMTVLFLGQIVLRKGIEPLFEAIRRIKPSVPIKFDFVGPVLMDIPDDIARDARVALHGSVPHADADRFYSEADVFILPTFSDGFAITQIEARAMKLPVIASRHCGDVVKDGKNGLLLDSVTPEFIVQALMRCVEDAPAMARMSAEPDEGGDEASIGAAWTGIFST